MKCDDKPQANKRLGSRLKERAVKLKEELYAIYLAARDKRTPWYAKALAAVAIGYTLSPLDIIPDFIPVIGFFDDLLIVPGLILLTMKLIPPEVLKEHKEKIEREGCPRLKPNWIFTIVIAILWAAAILFIISLFVKFW